MEVDVPERVFFETEVYEIDDDLRVKKGKIRITEGRLIINGRDEMKILYLSGVRMVQIKRESRWGYMLAGLIFLLSSLILYSLAILYGVKSFVSAMVLFVMPTTFFLIASIMIYWWNVTRSYRLSISTDFDKELVIRSKNHEELVEIANAIELVKLGAVRKLHKKETRSLMG